MPITHLEHFLVLTDDIEATRDFYRDVLGLTVGPRPPLPFTGYWLYAGGAPCVHIAERASYTASSVSTRKCSRCVIGMVALKRTSRPTGSDAAQRNSFSM